MVAVKIVWKRNTLSDEAAALNDWLWVITQVLPLMPYAVAVRPPVRIFVPDQRATE
jgi:hypothetical protein